MPVRLNISNTVLPPWELVVAVALDSDAGIENINLSHSDSADVAFTERTEINPSQLAVQTDGQYIQGCWTTV